jgi:hypothetical protein
MNEEILILALTAGSSLIVLLLLRFYRNLTTLRIVILLFFLDLVMTVEAALYSDVVAIAVLHVITIPAFFALIYFDLVKQHRTYTRCFICGGKLAAQVDTVTVTRKIEGQTTELSVHKKCVSVDDRERKALSQGLSKKGNSR